MPDAFSLIRLTEARAWLAEGLAPAASRPVSPAEALGGIAAEPVPAPGDWPPAPAAREDGVAVVAADTAGAGVYSPLRLAFADGRSARVAAGEPVPAPCDAVVPFGDVTLESAAVVLTAAVAPGQGVRRRGADIAAGDPLLRPGQRLGPLALARLAALGVTAVTCREPPTVTVAAATGAQEAVTAAGLLAGLLHAAGCGVEAAAAPLTDDWPASSGPLLACGGSGEDPADTVAAILAAEGELFAGGVAMQPGLGTRLGRLGEQVVIVLPGQPWPAFAAAWLLLRDSVLPAPMTGQARLERKLASPLGVSELVPLGWGAEGLLPLPRDAVLPPATLAAVARVDEASEGHGAGEIVMVDWLEGIAYG